jgi:hypothetical protein
MYCGVEVGGIYSAYNAFGAVEVEGGDTPIC